VCIIGSEHAELAAASEGDNLGKNIDTLLPGTPRNLITPIHTALLREPSFRILSLGMLRMNQRFFCSNAVS
jgi:hypothetical protein